MLNAPLQPLLDFTRSLIENPPNISLFQNVWQAVVTIISMFYGLLFLYAGYQFLTSGHDVVKRELAKEWLKNTVLLIIFVQASYFLYDLVLNLGSSLASTVLAQIDPAFFQLTADNLINLGLEFLLVLVYVIVLLITIVVLTIRYLIVAAGVHLAEETGELSEALLAYRGERSERLFNEVTLEAADYFSCIMGVFNSIDVDLAEELSVTFPENCHVCRHAPCTCSFQLITTYKV